MTFERACVLGDIAEDEGLAVRIGDYDVVLARSGEGDVPLGRYRAALGRVPQVTPGSGDPPSPETVLGTGADLVVAGHVTGKDVQALERVGVPVIVPSWFCQPVFGTTAAVGFSSTYETIGLLGRIFGTTPAAEKSISDLRRRVETVHRHFAGKPRRTAANTYIAPSLLQAYGRSSVNDAVLTTLGLRNVYADQPQRNRDVSGESLIARDPDVVVISYGTAYGISDGTQAVRVFTAKSGLADLTAVREHRLLSLNYGYLTGGPLTVDGLETLARQLETYE